MGNKHGNATHGMCKTRMYRVWSNIKSRCYNDNHDAFVNYGGRGIAMCDDWFDSFLLFREWALENNYSDDLEIDRINNDGNYEPSNCRFVTRDVNAKNRRSVFSNNTSGYKGVVRKTDKNRWQAVMYINKKCKHIGYFRTPKEACIARDEYIIKNNLQHEYKLQALTEEK